jgi:hypothetical protein
MDLVCTIKVVRSLDDAPAGEVDDHAMIQVKFTYGVIEYTFLITEPRLVGRSAWNQLLNQDPAYIGFYCGNGEGYVNKHENVYTFVSAPEGAGGDVVGRFKVPAGVFDPVLAEFLQQAGPHVFQAE